MVSDKMGNSIVISQGIVIQFEEEGSGTVVKYRIIPAGVNSFGAI
jgi:hypothetical protein